MRMCSPVCEPQQKQKVLFHGPTFSFLGASPSLLCPHTVAFRASSALLRVYYNRGAVFINPAVLSDFYLLALSCLITINWPTQILSLVICYHFDRSVSAYLPVSDIVHVPYAPFHLRSISVWPMLTASGRQARVDILRKVSGITISECFTQI
jgi:hypothetical protein